LPRQVISAKSVNERFPRYPITVEDKGWVYGVWYCGTSWTRVGLHGQYPPTFLKRALALFPHARDILHVPSGTLGKRDGGITVDRIVDQARRPMVMADASALPFNDEAFDLVLSDPPYSNEDSKLYGCEPYPLGKSIKEAWRVLRPGGHLGMLHTFYPSYRRQDWRIVGLIAVITGFHRATRVFSVFRKVGIPKSLESFGHTHAEP